MSVAELFSHYSSSHEDTDSQNKISVVIIPEAENGRRGLRQRNKIEGGKRGGGAGVGRASMYLVLSYKNAVRKKSEPEGEVGKERKRGFPLWQLLL